MLRLFGEKSWVVPEPFLSYYYYYLFIGSDGDLYLYSRTRLKHLLDLT